MRKFDFTAPDGSEHTMTATFAASMEIAEKVADPLYIAREAAVEAAIGPGYQPKFRFTVQNVVTTIHIGIKAGGGNLSIKQVQELVFEMGLRESMELASRYVAMIITPKSERVQDAADDAPKEAAPGE